MLTSPETTYEESLRKSRREILERLRSQPPVVVARELEKAGWSWQWACAAVETIEYQHNPAGVSPDAKSSQQIRDRLQAKAGLGAGLFILGLIVSLGTLALALHSGGWILITYGAVFSGAVMWLNAYSQLKQRPDRTLPRYVPPRDHRVHDPSEY